MDLWRSLSGMMEGELTSAALEAALDAIRKANIPIFQVQAVSDLTLRFSFYRRDCAAMVRLCESRGEALHIMKKKGIFWPVFQLRNRPVLLVTAGLLIMATLVLPRYVLFAQVKGNESIPTNQILEAAEMCGITFGANRREVRSEQIKNALLAAVPELQWAGVNTRGCVAEISVTEKPVQKMETKENRVSSIVALRDGIIRSCTATRGNLLCREGQAVQEGQTLISGYTDCGLSIRATRAEGEIFADTVRLLQVITPQNSFQFTEGGEKKHKISLLLGKKRINLWKDSGIWDATCGRMYKEYYMRLPGGFSLPLALCIETAMSRTLWEAPVSKENTETSLLQLAEAYLLRQMTAGQILSQETSVVEKEDVYLLKGSFVCSEMIGIERIEKIGEENG